MASGCGLVGLLIEGSHCGLWSNRVQPGFVCSTVPCPQLKLPFALSQFPAWRVVRSAWMILFCRFGEIAVGLKNHGPFEGMPGIKILLQNCGCKGRSRA